MSSVIGFSKYLNDEINILTPRVNDLNHKVNNDEYGNIALNVKVNTNTSNTTLNTNNILTNTTDISSLQSSINDPSTGLQALKDAITAIDPDQIAPINQSITSNANKIIRNSELWESFQGGYVLFPTHKADAYIENDAIEAHPLPLNVHRNEMTKSQMTSLITRTNPSIRNGGWTLTGEAGLEWDIWNESLTTYGDTYSSGTFPKSVKASDLEFAYCTLRDIGVYKNNRFGVNIPTLKITLKDGSVVEFKNDSSNNFDPLNDFEQDDAVTYIASPNLEDALTNLVEAKLTTPTSSNGFGFSQEQLADDLKFYYTAIANSALFGGEANATPVENYVKSIYHGGKRLGGTVDEIVNQLKLGISFFEIFGVNEMTHMLPINKRENPLNSVRFPLVNFKKSEFRAKLLQNSQTISRISIVVPDGYDAKLTLASVGIKFKNDVLQTIEFNDKSFAEPEQRLIKTYPWQWDEMRRNEYNILTKSSFEINSFLHENTIKTMLFKNNIKDYTGNFEDFVVSHSKSSENFDFELADCMFRYTDDDDTKTIGNFKFNGSENGTKTMDVIVKYHSHATQALKDAETTQNIKIVISADGNTKSFVKEADDTPVILEWGKKYSIVSIVDNEGNLTPKELNLNNLTFTNGLDWRYETFIHTNIRNDIFTGLFIGASCPVPTSVDGYYPVYIIPDKRFSEYLYPTSENQKLVLDATKNKLLDMNYGGSGNFSGIPDNGVGVNTISPNIFYDGTPIQVIDGEQSITCSGFNDIYASGNVDINLTTIKRAYYYLHKVQRKRNRSGIIAHEKLISSHHSRHSNDWISFTDQGEVPGIHGNDNIYFVNGYWTFP